MGIPKKLDSDGYPEPERRQPHNKTPPHWGGSPDPEELDTTPIELPIGAGKPLSLQEMIANAVYAELSAQEDADDVESWDEANDFEPDEEEGLLDVTRYTIDEMEDDLPPEPLSAPEADDTDDPGTPPSPESDERPDEAG